MGDESPNIGTLTGAIQVRFPQRVMATHRFRGQETVLVKREGLLELARFLKDEPPMRFDFLMDLTCVDYLTFGISPSSAPALATPSPLPYYMKPKPVQETWDRFVSHDACRFEVVYHFYSSTHRHRLRVKVPLSSADPVVDSLTGLWAAANWFEREVWDLFGIRFAGHPDLKRILMYESFQGHPLRKDYPVRKRQPLIGPLN
ncbi:MAG: NADH-quinone oxidoreductase subunit C [Candidatus Omnitrophica bacterium]|nr:NADH-quinone oxidoreductase subunit C [Candidatus Omnitrophota bacterium]MBI2495684.1 NADH-quinone oxidoreductase subunit C [Candidatus Omnitrophota bacterium]MBI3020991.1 NADH-quinone oxidoreductase subunit C [Candidatus Omnitrophota bacterium]